MQVPPELKEAIDAFIAGSSLSRLREDFSVMSQKYRTKRQRNKEAIVSTREDVQAYVATRLPSIYVVARIIFDEMAERFPQFAPESLLDIGAGPGTILWAAQSTFGASLLSANLADCNSQFREAGRFLAKRGRSKVFRQLDWTNCNMERLEQGFKDREGVRSPEGAVAAAPSGDTEPQSTGYDIVTASYVLGELSVLARMNLVQRAWAATTQALILIEPGTPPGFDRIAKARQQLIDAGARIFAPCAGDGACPMFGMGEKRWCHFAARVERIRAQRQGKGAELAFEDEKYSYVVAFRGDMPRIGGRVVDTPVVTKFDATINLCNESARLETERVLKRQAEKYKQYKRLEWGSYLEL